MTTTPTPLRVLVLEDRSDDAELMILGLVEAGFAVSWIRVDSEPEFLAALSPELDVILADYTLPSFDVQQALRCLGESGLSVPLIVVSGTISEEAAVDCIKRGAVDYLVKDRLGRLPTAVSAGLESRRLREEQAAAAAELARTAAELSTANEALRAADEVKDHLLAVTAHELRTPLTSILGFSALLRQEWDGSARELGPGWLAVVEDQAHRMLSYVEDLVTLSAVKLGAVTINCRSVPVAAALRGAGAVAVPAGITVSCDDQLTVYADPIRLEQILVNLLGNAVKHGGPHIRAEAYAAESGATVELRIRDDGPGVPADFVAVMFDKFAQAASRSSGPGGCGLGLAIVASLTAAQNGEVWYEPDSPSGACFAVRLPAPRTSSDTTGVR